MKEERPVNAFSVHMRRAKGVAGFLHFVIETWSHAAFEKRQDSPDGLVPRIELYRPEMDGLLEVLGVIGESMDLAEDAAMAAMEEPRP
ncbi:MAG: hypothetical protein HQL83_12425 [Magnetococcales bacterium]|nr:hypothetical protein [Magnetococcales bacterium]MBF0347762.1 hypothetical protein [Magnetococcales bacterium]MBF0632883.1 hypothetical protein [Magnetococcales bacterium]